MQTFLPELAILLERTRKKYLKASGASQPLSALYASMRYLFERARKIHNYSRATKCPSTTALLHPRFHLLRLIMDVMGGYDYSFIETPPDELVCKICQYPVRDPLLSECCGQNFCKSCLEIYADLNASYCPYCRRNGFNAFHDRRTERVILSYHVNCSSEGCQWKGELRHVGKHEEYCEFAKVTCPNNCGKEIQRKYVQEHCKVTCKLRPVTCEYCHTSGSFDFIHGEHLKNCNKMPVECPNRCGVGKMARSKLEDHLELCPLQYVACDYAGCTAKLLRKEKEHHNCINMAEHLEMVSKNLQKSQEKIEVLEEKYSMLTELVRVAVCTHQSLPWPVRILVECQLRNDYEYPFIIKIEKLSNVRYDQCSMVYSSSFYSKRNGYHLRLFLTSSLLPQPSYNQVLLGWQLLPGDHDNQLGWPINCSLRLEVLNQLNDSNHVYCNGRVNGISRTSGRQCPPFFNIQTISGRINMNHSYINDDIMYVRVLEITFEN